MKGWLVLGIIVFFLTSCASEPSPVIAPLRCQTNEHNWVIASGRLDRDHGDRLRPEPRDNDAKTDYFLIRTANYIDVMEYLDGKRLRLLLRPIGACDLQNGSSELACGFRRSSAADSEVSSAGHSKVRSAA